MAEDKLTPKQENFARKYIELSNASEAYRQSYDAENMAPKTIWEEASRTLANPVVATRIMELQEGLQEKHEVTVGTIAKELDEARNLASRIEQPSPMVSASMGKAKLYGLVTDKTQLSGDPDKPVKIDVNLTPDEAYRQMLDAD